MKYRQMSLVVSSKQVSGLGFDMIGLSVVLAGAPQFAWISLDRASSLSLGGFCKIQLISSPLLWRSVRQQKHYHLAKGSQQEHNSFMANKSIAEVRTLVEARHKFDLLSTGVIMPGQ